MNTRDRQRRLMKFACHELTAQDEAELLLEAEREPARWRDLTLALLEERRIAHALAAAAPAGAAPTPVPRARNRRRWPLAAAACLGGLGGAAWLYVSHPRPPAPPPVAQPPQAVHPPAHPVDAEPQTAARPSTDRPGRQPMTRPWFTDQQHAQARAHGFTLEEQPLTLIVRRKTSEPLVMRHQHLRLVRHAP